jgi:hypothetical protein
MFPVGDDKGTTAGLGLGAGEGTAVGSLGAMNPEVATKGLISFINSQSMACTGHNTERDSNNGQSSKKRNRVYNNNVWMKRKK